MVFVEIRVFFVTRFVSCVPTHTSSWILGIDVEDIGFLNTKIGVRPVHGQRTQVIIRVDFQKGLSVGGCGIAFPFSPDLRFLQKLSDALASISCSATELQPLTIDLQSTPRFLFFFFFSISGKRGLARFFSISGEDPRGLAPIETKKFSRGSILGSLRCCCCCFLDLHRCLTTAASWIFTGTKTRYYFVELLFVSMAGS
ncbi:hypothetical protein L484_013306 [Morus notabilis]|uniref:Uncharacterized protein n=1 Tax=Morus notabilis TaxID=981085 RepID=W9QT73_9ROSA|nr:hypothetical protein L484_013306 [Morus notabilis]